MNNTDLQLLESARLASLGTLAGGIAHEINNPLAIIMAYADKMKFQIERGRVEPHELIKSINRIQETVERTTRIVRGLKAIARTSSNDPKESVLIDLLLHDTLELCRERLRANQITLSSTCELNINVRCRPTQISQVIINLLNNAIDVIVDQEERWINIEILKVGGQVLFKMSDSGLGILPEIREKIMEPFFTTKPPGKGSGLGLSIARSIIKDHGGELYLETNSENTTFVFTLALLD